MSDTKTTTRNISVGVERVLYAAATDETFRAALLEDRKGALERRGVHLLDSERAMLLAIPRAQLEASIASLDVSPVNVKRRRFLGAVALGTVTVAAGAAGCSDDDGPGPATGSRPDDFTAMPEQGLDAVAGVRDLGIGDQGVDVLDLDSGAIKGIRPGG